MERFDHIELSSTNFEATRLRPVLGYLAAKLSPYDLKLINSLNDHKGTLEVYLDANEFNHAVAFAGETYKDHLLKILKEAWEIENEYLVELILD
ncbi:hypothetical protein AAW12_08670 [Sphingobacterium sp. Ag1]|uniref:hypothetical protein n=1 Tax=Sphingobacterium sp. Ag1 TaxID=1643451 RepID=UPI0006274DBA|nr:hypothetical protein [Sphingobacterium sp. Ag1]KKO91725.1 hypothetical protein AAW12_08670 [Sphingobacterium sp. Ag1]